MLFAQATNNFNINFESQTLYNAFLQWIYLKWGWLIIFVFVFIVLYFSTRWLVKYFLREHEESKMEEKNIEERLLKKADKVIKAESKMDLLGKMIDKEVGELDGLSREMTRVRDKLDKLSRLKDLT